MACHANRPTINDAVVSMPVAQARTGLKPGATYITPRKRGFKSPLMNFKNLVR